MTELSCTARALISCLLAADTHDWTHYVFRLFFSKPHSIQGDIAGMLREDFLKLATDMHLNSSMN